MVKHILFFCVFVWTCVFAFGEENKLYGPDGKLCVIHLVLLGCFIWYFCGK